MIDSSDISSDSENNQILMEAADLNESVKLLRERLEAAAAGQKGVSAKQVLAEVRARLGLAKR